MTTYTKRSQKITPSQKADLLIPPYGMVVGSSWNGENLSCFTMSGSPWYQDLALSEIVTASEKGIGILLAILEVEIPAHPPYMMHEYHQILGVNNLHEHYSRGHLFNEDPGPTNG